MRMNRWWVSVVLVLAIGLRVGAQERHMPPAQAPGPFTAPIVEMGALGIDQIVALEGAYGGHGPASGQMQNLLFYDKDTGSGLLVKNCGALYGVLGHPVYETAEWVHLAPGLLLVAVREEHQRLQTLLGYQASTGRVYRYPQRNTGAC